jgi:hypothetical protein
MAKATIPEPQPVTLLLSREEAEDLRGLLFGHVGMNSASARLTAISDALGFIGVQPTKFIVSDDRGLGGNVIILQRMETA